MAEVSSRQTNLSTILANRHPALWEEIIGQNGRPSPDTIVLEPRPTTTLGAFGVRPDPWSLSEMSSGVHFGLKTAFTVIRAAGLARLLGVAVDLADICPPEPPPFPPLPEPPDPVPWHVGLARIPNFYADYALGLAIGLDTTTAHWQGLPSADAIDRLREQAGRIAA